MKTFLYCLSTVFLATVLLPSLAHRKPEEKEDELSDISEEVSEAVTVINNGTIGEMDLEEYITGVVLAEMPASYDSEALKAQAVAARTYAVNKIRSGAHDGGAVCTDYSCCQAYIDPQSYTGGEENLNKVKDAVSDTAGEIMTFEGEPITAVFHSMSAGRTTSAESAWGSSVPYLCAVDSPLEETEENFITYVTVPLPEFSEKLKTLSEEYNGTAETGEIVTDSSGYVKSAVIGQVAFTGSDLRTLFNLRSANFTLSSDGINVLFTVKGYGHGVGMSQHGANLLAQKGENYRNILKTYYTGISIDKL